MRKILLLITILISILNISAFNVELIKSDPAPIVAGDYADLTFRMINTANDDLEDIEIFVKDSNLFYQVSDNANLKIVYGKEEITRTFRLFFNEDISQGYIDVSLIIEHSGIFEEKKVRVYVQENLESAKIYLGEINSIPDELIRDTKDNKLKITFQNLGDKSADLFLAELKTDSKNVIPSSAYSFTDSLSSIEAGGEGVVEFTLDIKENTSELIPMWIDLRYREKKGIGSGYDIIDKRIDFNLELSESPFLKIEKVELLNDFTIGTSENKVKLTIKNEGNIEAENVRIRVRPDISYPITFQDVSQYISSSINPNSSKEVIFELEVLKSAQVREYDINVLLESMVGESRYEREDTMTIKTKEGQKTSIQTYGIIVIGLIIIFSVIIGIFSHIGSKKKSQ